jgi:ABC-type lipoprotein export system ATPase subunit
MLKPNPKPDKAKLYLKLFNNDLDAAVESLRLAAKEAAKSTKKAVVPADAPVVVEAQAVTKTYKLGSERITALDNIDLTIQQGEFVAITGESGSGKSTLLQLIGGLDKPSDGKIIVDGHDIKKLSDRKLSIFRNRSIGFVFQFFYLQPFLNTQVNLEVPGMFARTSTDKRHKSSQELAEAVGLADRLRHLPKELSGGQMQRAAIARALLNRPKVLLADEPTGNLDQANSRAIIDLFEAVRKKYGTTVVIVTHDRNIAARADREISLRDGKLVSA